MLDRERADASTREGHLLPLLLFGAVVVASAMAVAAAYRFLGTRVSQLSIVSPSGGSVAQVGAPVVVRVATGGVGLVRSELLVEGVPVDRVPAPRMVGLTDWPVEHVWQADSPGQYRLSVLVTDLSGHSVESPSITFAVVPPGSVAFSSNRAGNYDIYSMYTDGSRVTSFIDEEGQKREPCCGPGQSVLFTLSLARQGSDICLMDSHGGRARSLTASLGGDHWARWAPDGTSIAFVSDRYGLSQLFLMDPDGGSETQLTSQSFPMEEPSWSPDGTALVFAAQSEDNWDVFTVSLSGAPIDRLTEDPGQDWQPAWSPDGSDIAFVSDREGRQQIYLMRADGSAQRRITAFPRGAEQPSWSPDGDWILCVAYTGEGRGLDSREVYLMRSDGTDPVRLTDNTVDDTEPTWCE